MKSPFPGMDPYMERRWGDVHHRLITYACDTLQAALPPELQAVMDLRLFVESEDGPYRAVVPVVRVVEHRPSAEARQSTAATDLAVEDPLILRMVDEPARQAYLEIIDVASGNRVITVIEFLSPSNKVPGQGQDLYRRKQREVYAAGASLVEIDLVRSGQRVMFVQQAQIPPSHRTTYQVVVRRGWRALEAEIYRAPLEKRLPVIHIPLRQTDKDVPLDLQALVDQCYQNGRYDRTDYRAEPLPPLEGTDAGWADELLRSKGLR